MLQKIKTIFDKYLPTVLTIVAIYMMAFSFFSIFKGVKNFDSDNYFMFSHGKLIMEQGFTSIEPLTLHEGFNFVYPQWLFAIIIYNLKIHFGNTAIAVFMLFVYFLLFLILYKIIRLITDNHENSLVSSVIIFTLLSQTFVTIRPYVTTVTLVLLEIYFLERLIHKDDKKAYIGLFIASILQINFHNSLWISSTLIILCYIGEFVVNKLIKISNSFDIKKILIAELIILFGGLINPYGYKYIIYILASMQSVKPFFGYIRELMPPNLFSGRLFYYCIIIDTIILSYNLLYKKREIPLRYLFMYFGFVIMSFSAIRNAIFFFTIGQIPVVYTGKYLKPLIKRNDVLFRASIASFILMSLSCAICLTVPDSIDWKGEYSSVDWLTEVDPKNMGSDMFTSFNTGAYAEYKGNYKAYIDARAEIFGIANNKKKDVVEEYLSLIKKPTKEKYDELIKNYDFKYILTDSTDINKFVKEDENYVLLYGKDTIKLFQKRDI